MCEAHVRYPDGFLLAQGLVYAKYHMADPEVFYNQEDLWVRATEKYYAQRPASGALLRHVAAAWLRARRVRFHPSLHAEESSGA